LRSSHGSLVNAINHTSFPRFAVFMKIYLSFSVRDFLRFFEQIDDVQKRESTTFKEHLTQRHFDHTDATAPWYHSHEILSHSTQ